MDQSVFKNAPDWVRWFAVDECGVGFWYGLEPEKLTSVWALSDYDQYDEVLDCGTFDLTGVDWTQTLIQREI